VRVARWTLHRVRLRRRRAVRGGCGAALWL
jgi:hypothetical protein